MHNGNSLRVADIIGAALESQSQHRQTFAFKNPKGVTDFLDESLPLLIVDLHHFIEQAEIIATMLRDGAKRFYIFGKAGAAVADSGIEEAFANADISAHPFAHLADIGAHALTDRGHRIDE